MPLTAALPGLLSSVDALPFLVGGSGAPLHANAAHPNRPYAGSSSRRYLAFSGEFLRPVISKAVMSAASFPPS